MNSRILVSGVSGPIGAALLPSLKTSGCSVVRLVRGAATGEGQIAWNPAAAIAPETVSGFDAVIHLAGEGIFGRWTAAKKAKIRDSRIAGTMNLAQALARAEEKPKVFVCGSAIGYYGNRGDEILREESAPGTGLLAQVCKEGEQGTMAPGAAQCVALSDFHDARPPAATKATHSPSCCPKVHGSSLLPAVLRANKNLWF